MWQKFSTIILLIALLQVGCDRPTDSTDQTTYRTGEPPVTSIEDDDTAMNAAIAKARETVSQFIEALENPKPTDADFSVKLRIGEGEHTEHMWLSPVRYNSGKFIGILGNEPIYEQKVKFGDQVEVAENEITDWMYVNDGKLVGGYSIRVLRDKMSPSQRKEFDNSAPFKFE